MSENPSLPDNERAAYYALLARLFGAPPDASLLTIIAMNCDAGALPGRPGVKAWRWVVREAANLPLASIGAEYWALFGGSASLIDLHGSSYAATAGPAGLLATRETARHRESARARLAPHFQEDHLAVVCATMQALIEGIDELGPAPLSLQQLFFSHHIAPWFVACCRTIRECPVAEFYRIGAEWAEAFLKSERDRLAVPPELR